MISEKIKIYTIDLGALICSSFEKDIPCYPLLYNMPLKTFISTYSYYEAYWNTIFFQGVIVFPM
jgi:hypothetical protein